MSEGRQRAGLMRALVRDGLDVALVLRRDDAALPEQPAQLVLPSVAGTRRTNASAEETRGTVEVWGGPDLDIAVGDAFNDTSGTLYRVDFVSPDRLIGTFATAEVVQ